MSTAGRENAQSKTPLSASAKEGQGADGDKIAFAATIHMWLPVFCEACKARAAGVHFFQPEGQALQLIAQCGLKIEEAQLLARVPLPPNTKTQNELTGPELCELLATAPGTPWINSPMSFGAQPIGRPPAPRGVLWVFAGQQSLASTSGAIVTLAAGLLSELLTAQATSLPPRGGEEECWALLNGLPDALWTIELAPQVRTILVSAGITRLTGYPPEDFVAHPDRWLKTLHPDDRPQLLGEIKRILAGRTNELRQRIRIVRADGAIRWAYSRGCVERRGEHVRVYGLTTDVTDQVMLEERIRRADRLAAVNMLAAGIAHEYNNLHFAMSGTLELLLARPDLSPAVREGLQHVRASAERASEITNQLVALARGGSGQRETLDITQSIEALLSLIAHELETNGIETIVRHQGGPLYVYGNRAELGQALLNLLLNAQQALQGRPIQRLEVQTGRDPQGQVYIRVSDTGHGILPEHLPRLFDPFFTTKGAAGSWLEKRAEEDVLLAGRGLGLTVAQRIVQEHGGHITVESTPNEGSTFTIYLPEAPMTMEDRPTISVIAPEVSRCRPARILIVDDESAVRLVCRELLQTQGHEVVEASSGQEAWERVQQERFDLVLVDLRMPDMDGLDLIQRLNSLPRQPIILVLTGDPAPLPEASCKALHIAGTVQKSSNFAALTTKIEQALLVGIDHS